MKFDSEKILERMKRTVDAKALAHCRYCFEPMYCIYDSALRDLCYQCLEDIKYENAQDVLRGGG